jgi:hypothetical protein
MIEVSTGAQVMPAVGEAVDFTGPALFTVTARDGTTTQEWSVVVDVLPNTETELLEFSFAEQSGPAVIDGDLQQVSIEVLFGTDVTSLVPTIVTSDGATIDPPSGADLDFSSPVIFTVIAEDGIAKQTWTVYASEETPSNSAEITSFGVEGQVGATVIEPGTHAVLLVMPFGTDVTALVPSIGISDGATIDPGSGKAIDFSVPVPYTVTAEDGITSQEWMVSVSFAANDAADIVGFALEGQKGAAVIENDLLRVTAGVPYGTDITSLVPAIEVSPGATILPASGVAADFSIPVVYTVTAQDGISSSDWTVQVVVLANTEADIISFSLAEQSGNTFIDGGNHEITLEVPHGTDVAALAPTIELSPGAVVDPSAGVDTDFTAPVVYTVTAEDGVTKLQWMVSVRILPNVETEITGFTLAEQTRPAAIDPVGCAVTVEVTPGTDITALSPQIEVSPGAAIDPPSGVAMDFSKEMVYTVTAEDGITSRPWVVKVALAPALSLEPGDPSGRFTFYPNPAEQFLVVELEGKGDIFLQDLNGKVVTAVTGASDRVTLPVAHLEPGVYVITVKTESFREVAKVILK